MYSLRISFPLLEFLLGCPHVIAAASWAEQTLAGCWVRCTGHRLRKGTAGKTTSGEIQTCRTSHHGMVLYFVYWISLQTLLETQVWHLVYPRHRWALVRPGTPIVASCGERGNCVWRRRPHICPCGMTRVCSPVSQNVVPAFRLFSRVTSALSVAGTYFARDAAYSSRFCKDDIKHGNTFQIHGVSVQQRHLFRAYKSMFLARVLIGDYINGDSKYMRPPSKDGSYVNLYDSCVDDTWNPKIFVVFDANQIYPEYLIDFH